MTHWRLSHWIRWRQFHFPLATLGGRVGVGLFWAWYAAGTATPPPHTRARELFFFQPVERSLVFSFLFFFFRVGGTTLLAAGPCWSEEPPPLCRRYWHIPLCQGGTAVVIPARLTVDVGAMVEHLARHRADWVDCLTPGQLQLMTEVRARARTWRSSGGTCASRWGPGVFCEQKKI